MLLKDIETLLREADEAEAMRAAAGVGVTCSDDEGEEEDEEEDDLDSDLMSSLMVRHVVRGSARRKGRGAARQYS